jgi:hypothetical protein
MDANHDHFFLRSVISDPQRGLPRRTRHIAPTLALITALLFAGSALSAVRIGTNGSETIVGTNGNDQLNGKGGDDILKGKAGNDMYYFADAWGSDSLVETAKGGIDTVNFHHVVTGPVAINLVPEWTSLGSNFNGVVSLSSSRVQFSYTLNGKAVESFVENAIGSQGVDRKTGNGDLIVGGGGKNILQPGGGGFDSLRDVGGWNDGPEGRPEIPVSNDVYKGFASNTGTDFVIDYGGNGDVLDLRPFSTEEIYFDAIDTDDDGATETLQIVMSTTTQVLILGQFADVPGLPGGANFHGRIETIIFTDETIKDIGTLQALGSTSANATSAKQRRLAAAAEGLAKEARTLAARHDALQ